jgi:hypothetical protein
MHSRSKPVDDHIQVLVKILLGIDAVAIAEIERMTP